MPIITGFDVAISNQDTWHPVEVVAPDPSRKSNDPMPSNGKEYRYWQATVTVNGVTEKVEGRLLIAGPTATSVPTGAVVVPKGQHHTWGRVTDGPEVIIEKASPLVIE